MTVKGGDELLFPGTWDVMSKGEGKIGDSWGENSVVSGGGTRQSRRGVGKTTNV